MTSRATLNAKRRIGRSTLGSGGGSHSLLLLRSEDHPSERLVLSVTDPQLTEVRDLGPRGSTIMYSGDLAIFSKSSSKLEAKLDRLREHARG